MTRLTLLITAVLICSVSAAQQSLYTAVKALIQEKYPAVSIENRLLAINTWSERDAASRETNKRYEKVAEIYRVARLKGGPAGLIGVTVNITDPTAITVSALKQDGIVHLLLVDGDQLAGYLKEGPANVVFDAAGTIIYEDLESDEVFNAVLNLISR